MSSANDTGAASAAPARTSTQDDPRFDRLPKWAQSHIWQLEREVERVQAELADGPADSDTFVLTGHGRPDRPLHRGEKIEFRLGGQDWIQVRLEADDLHGPMLYVMSARDLEIRPQSSNTIRIYGDPKMQAQEGRS